MALPSVSSATKPSTSEESSTIRYVPLDWLLERFNKNNPKDHDIGLIMESIDRHGFVGAVTLDSRTEILAAGHGRCKGLAARRADGQDRPEGIVGDDWQVPMVEKYFETDTERDAYTIGDNQSTIAGGWDAVNLLHMLEGIAEADVDDPFKGTGYDGDDLDAMIAESAVDPEQESETPYKPTQYGIVVKLKDSEAETRLFELLFAHGYEGKRLSTGEWE